MFAHLPIFIKHTALWHFHNISTSLQLTTHLIFPSFIIHLKKLGITVLICCKLSNIIWCMFFSMYYLREQQEFIKSMLNFNFSFLMLKQMFKAQPTKSKQFPLNLFPYLL